MKKYIALTLVLIMCLSLVPFVTFAAPDGLSRLAVVGSGIPGVGEWDINDAAGDMTEVSESVYGKTLMLTAGTEMRFKIATDDGRGGWNDAFNFGSATLTLGTVAEMDNGGGSGDMFFKADKDMTVKITVDLNPLKDGGKATILLVEDIIEPEPTVPTVPTVPTEPTGPTPPEEENTDKKYTLTVEVPSSWTTVNVYTWDPEAFGTYPGSAMSKVSGNTYKCEINGDIKNIIISNQDDMKTDDLIVRPGCDVTIVVTPDCRATITYPGSTLPRPPLPEPLVELSNYRVVGNADWLGNWNPAFEGGRMWKLSDGTYRASFADVPPGSYEIKITKDGKWDGTPNGESFTFTVVQKSKITVDFTLRDGVGVISVYGAAGWWDDGEEQDQEENPKSADLPLSLPIALLLCSVAAVPVLLNKRKEFQ